MYLLGYTLMLFIVIISLKTMQVYKLSDLTNVQDLRGFNLGLQFFNLGGVPPLFGFMLKLMLVKLLCLQRMFLLIILILNSLILLFVYTTLIYQVYCVSPRFNLRARRETGLQITSMIILGLWGRRVII